MATLKKENSQLADRSQKPLIGQRQSAITAPSLTTPSANETALLNAVNSLITALEAHGLVESND